MSSAYLRLLIFLLTILIPACASHSLAFCMMYSAYKLNKQGDNIQPWRIPFPICKLPVVPCPVLTVASWPAHRFFRRQVRSLLKLKSIESMMPSNHLILCCPLLFLPSILPGSGSFLTTWLFESDGQIIGASALGSWEPTVGQAEFLCWCGVLQSLQEEIRPYLVPTDG